VFYLAGKQRSNDARVMVGCVGAVCRAVASYLPTYLPTRQRGDFGVVFTGKLAMDINGILLPGRRPTVPFSSLSDLVSSFLPTSLIRFLF
jgi:hypothetical protein